MIKSGVADPGISYGGGSRSQPNLARGMWSAVCSPHRSQVVSGTKHQPLMILMHFEGCILKDAF